MTKSQDPILFNLPVPIITPRLILRAPQIGDGVALNEAILESFDMLNQFMLWADHQPSVDESETHARMSAANWILKKNDEPYLPLYIFDKKTQQLIGATGYHHYDWDVPSIETGYWIRTPRSGEGLMREAVNALTQYAFKQLKMKRLTITCDINNIRSKRVPEALNFQLESIAKANRVNPDGKIGDTCIYVRFDLNNLPALDVTW
jgi:ribosomal-protein-serine acetyltransferase